MSDVLYDNSFMCTYKQLDDDDIYRVQFLQAFMLEDWDDTLVRNRMVILFDKIGHHFKKIIEEIMIKTSILSHMLLFLGNSPNKIDVFQCLFCADVFQETHRCICDAIHTNTIPKDHYTALENTLFNIPDK